MDRRLWKKQRAELQRQELQQEPTRGPGRPPTAVMERPGPTEETVSKLRPDPLRELFEAKKLDHAGLAAAFEIQAVWAALCQPLMPKAAKTDREGGTGKKPDMPDHLSAAHAQRYVPWVAETGPRIISAVLDVVVDSERGRGATELEICRAIKDYAGRMTWAERRQWMR